MTPSDARRLRCRPLEMLTYFRVCCAFESACALPSGVIRSFETTSNDTIHFQHECPLLHTQIAN
jgi:hypothetical protein